MHLLPVDLTQAHEAARQCCLLASKGLPRRRAATVLLLGWSAQPGMCIAPWTLRGTMAAIDRRQQSRTQPEFLGASAANEGIASRVDDANQIQADSVPALPPLFLKIPGFRRAARIPGHWPGTTLHLVMPLMHRHRGQGLGWAGPMQSALASLAQHCGVQGRVEPQARAGANIITSVFAGSVAVLDATWWAAASPVLPAAPRHLPRGSLHARPNEALQLGARVAPEHCLATQAIRDHDESMAIDAWISIQLGLQEGTLDNRGVEPLRILGKRYPWPHTRLPSPGSSSTSHGLAGRAIEALWRTRNSTRPATRGRSMTALPAPVPGPFAALWHQAMQPASAKRP